MNLIEEDFLKTKTEYLIYFLLSLSKPFFATFLICNIVRKRERELENIRKL
jgi:hypothetical protein